MEYLLDLRWADPVASAVARILSALPDGVAPTTGSRPPGTSRGVEVLQIDSPVALTERVDAITRCRADVRVIGERGS